MHSSGYLDRQRHNEWREILKGFLPPGLLRLRMYLRLRRRFPGAFISGDSCVDTGARVGRGCVIRSSHLGPNVSLGDFSTLGHGCSLAGEGAIEIGKFCSIAPGVFICSRGHRHLSRTTYPLQLWLDGQTLRQEEHSVAPVCIGNDVWIGQRVIILAGATIPDGCVVGAGSVVGKREYPPYSIIAGTPANVRKMRFGKNHVQELLDMCWWDRDPREIFGGLLDYLHQTPDKDSYAVDRAHTCRP